MRRTTQWHCSNFLPFVKKSARSGMCTPLLSVTELASLVFARWARAKHCFCCVQLLITRYHLFVGKCNNCCFINSSCRGTGGLLHVLILCNDWQTRWHFRCWLRLYDSASIHWKSVSPFGKKSTMVMRKLTSKRIQHGKLTLSLRPQQWRIWAFSTPAE